MTSSKIQSLPALADTLRALKAQGKKVVQCHGVFDLLHPGHVHHLKLAKAQGDILVVTLTNDVHVRKGPGRPVFNEALRLDTIAALEIVDFVCLIDDYTAIPAIQQLRPDVYVKGAEYRDATQDITGKISEEDAAVQEVGGRIFFTADDVVFSSTNLINRFMGVMSEVQRGYLQQIRKKYGTDREILDKLKTLKDLRVFVIGDTIIDEYVSCEPLGQSLKNPLVVHKYLGEERFCGGVVAVANQIAEFCKEVHLVTVLGDRDSHAEYVQSKLKPNVTAKFFERPDSVTVVKRRYTYANVDHKIFEAVYITDGIIPPSVEREMDDYISKVAGDWDAVAISDFGHGTLTEQLVRTTKRRAKFLGVNAQTNSANLGYNFITKKYSGLDFACVDEGEARLALHDKHENIELLGRRMLSQLDTARLIITRGKSGSVGFDRTDGEFMTPAFAFQVVDRVGAGDAFFSLAVPASAKGMPLELVSFVSNALGAMAVQVVGNRDAVSATNLFKFIATLLR